MPEQGWQHVSMDFIEKLPVSGGKDTVLVVDRFTRFAHFVPLAHPFTALQVAQLYLNTVCKFHGIPLSIVSDRDKVFTSSLWKELFKLLGCQTTAEHCIPSPD